MKLQEQVLLEGTNKKLYSIMLQVFISLGYHNKNLVRFVKSCSILNRAALFVLFFASLTQAQLLYPVRVEWVAPGDDGRWGRASYYDLRCSSAPITTSNFYDAIYISVNEPNWSGTWEHADVLLPIGIWYFAIKAGDEVINWSEMSNVVSIVVQGSGISPVVNLHWK